MDMENLIDEYLKEKMATTSIIDEGHYKQILFNYEEWRQEQSSDTVRLSFVDWLKENEPILVNHGGTLNIHQIEHRYINYLKEMVK